ncbi:putative MORN repeat [Trypanosoma vivax]|uniref:Phosphatidylinositol-4-phosphate 5-kinase n=1 Tax=Trypanosoma vivax (strain Y486) TaxID=1055687 RepID=G0UBS1_TRYVY|nr:hypothetical protein TRVL_08772 [Trypanosoma vivax]KAH8609606.1 putative MORN repeat [Trypanosoma vivax]CCC53269.1 conserved hypothetical protein [Trypanosoma vivax Y486]
MVVEDEATRIYEFLKGISPQNAAACAVPLTTVRRYVGGLDADGHFDGRGTLISAMGFFYEGTFVSGCMEGHGRIVWNSGATYEGFFRGGAPNGYGTLIQANNDKYVGEVRNSVRHGVGELTTAHGVYTGTWCNGKREGSGRQTYADSGSFYEGQWSENMRHGRGLLLYPNGDLYDGMWCRGKRHGKGSMGWKAGGNHFVEVYEGEWCDGIPHGHGRSTYVHYIDASRTPPDPDSLSDFAPSCNAVVNVYSGEFCQGKRHGFGVFFYADGSTYEGEWYEGKKEGRGKFTSNVGVTYFGNFTDDEINSLPGEEEGVDPLPTVSKVLLFGVGESSVEEATSALRLLVLRFNNALKDLFTTYSAKSHDIHFITTPSDWWRHRPPGHICTPQFLRLLNDAHIINGHITISEIIDCVVTTVEEEIKAEGIENEGPWTNRLKQVRSDLLRLDGYLSYRQFVESLVRLATLTCIGPHFGEVSRRFMAIVEGSLAKNRLFDEPLFPLSREYESALKPDVLAQLELLYLRLSGTSGAPSRDTCASLSMRTFVDTFRDLIRSGGMDLVDALNYLVPFDRFKWSGTVPSAVCPPRNAMGYSLYERSRGSRGEFAVEMVVSERRLTFVEFVELLLATVRLSGVTGVEEVGAKVMEILIPPSVVETTDDIRVDVHNVDSIW